MAKKKTNLLDAIEKRYIALLEGLDTGNMPPVEGEGQPVEKRDPLYELKLLTDASKFFAMKNKVAPPEEEEDEFGKQLREQGDEGAGAGTPRPRLRGHPRTRPVPPLGDDGGPTGSEPDTLQ